MVKFVILIVVVVIMSVSGVPVKFRDSPSMSEERNKTMSMLSLPSNATAIRADITDNFSCESKVYGYFADVENDCQIFHVCLPVTYADGKERTFRWSFICPEDTVFSQEIFTCVRTEDLGIECKESEKYYSLNDNFGMVEKMNDSVESSPPASAAASPAPARYLEKTNTFQESTTHLEAAQPPSNHVEKTNYITETAPNSQESYAAPTTTYKYTEYTEDADAEVENYLNEQTTIVKQIAPQVDPQQINDFFPTYFVHESFEEKMPDIFMPLKMNINNNDSNLSQESEEETVSSPPENEIKLQSLTNQSVENENDEHSQEKSHHEIKRRFLFKADANY